MPEIPIAYALSTKARIKDRLGIKEAHADTILDRILGGVTDLLEGECGGRRFKRTTYTNELHTIFNKNQKILVVRNIPLISVTTLEYKAGLKSNPNYTAFNTDDWEILDDGASGMVRVWGMGSDINAIRISYVGGYLVDFDNAGSPTAHTLPFDLSDLAERLTIKIYKRRQNEGEDSNTFDGVTVRWKPLIDEIDRSVINRYRRLPEFI